MSAQNTGDGGMVPNFEPVNTARERGESFAAYMDEASSSAAVDEAYDVSPRAHCFLGFHNRAFRSGDEVHGTAVIVPPAGVNDALTVKRTKHNGREA